MTKDAGVERWTGPRRVSGGIDIPPLSVVVRDDLPVGPALRNGHLQTMDHYMQPCKQEEDGDS